MDPAQPTQEYNDSKDQDWASKVSGLVVDKVDAVRNKTTGPALKASRYLVYSIAIGLIGIIALVVGFILLVRLLVVATGQFSFVSNGESWLAYLIIGFVFVLLGSLLWRKKENRKQADDENS